MWTTFVVVKWKGMKRNYSATLYEGRGSSVQVKSNAKKIMQRKEPAALLGQMITASLSEVNFGVAKSSILYPILLFLSFKL